MGWGIGRGGGHLGRGGGHLGGGGGILGRGEQGYTWGRKRAYIWVGGPGGWCQPRLVLLTHGCDIKKGEKHLGKLSSSMT